MFAGETDLLFDTFYKHLLQGLFLVSFEKLSSLSEKNSKEAYFNTNTPMMAHLNLRTCIKLWYKKKKKNITNSVRLTMSIAAREKSFITSLEGISSLKNKPIPTPWQFWCTPSEIHLYMKLRMGPENQEIENKNLQGIKNSQLFAALRCQSFSEKTCF